MGSNQVRGKPLFPWASTGEFIFPASRDFISKKQCKKMQIFMSELYPVPEHGVVLKMYY